MEAVAVDNMAHTVAAIIGGWIDFPGQRLEWLPIEREARRDAGMHINAMLIDVHPR